MADTVTETLSAGMITLTYAGAGANWISKTTFPGGLKVKSIKFYPSAANDILVVRNTSISGPIMAKVKDTTGGGSADVSFGEGVWAFPHVVIADQTWNTVANAIVMIVIA